MSGVTPEERARRRQARLAPLLAELVYATFEWNRERSLTNRNDSPAEARLCLAVCRLEALIPKTGFRLYRYVFGKRPVDLTQPEVDALIPIRLQDSVMTMANADTVDNLLIRLAEQTRHTQIATASLSRLRRAIKGIVDREVLASLDPAQIRNMLVDGIAGMMWTLDEKSPRETWTAGDESVIIPHTGSWNRAKDVAVAIATLARLRGVSQAEVLADMLPDEDGSR